MRRTSLLDDVLSRLDAYEAPPLSHVVAAYEAERAQRRAFPDEGSIRREMERRLVVYEAHHQQLARLRTERRAMSSQLLQLQYFQAIDGKTH